MTEEVDAEARLDSRKGLLVIMILAILASTGYFFYVYIDKTFRFFKSTRKYMIFTLTAGDFFLALFPLIVFARGTFERRYRPGCPTTSCAMVYFTSYFPFVYAMGIICLCLELVFRYRIRAFFSKQDHCSVAVAALPWLLGLVLILPLTLAGMDWDDCSIEDNSVSRQRAVVWISVVLPSLFAVISCMIVKHTKFNVVPRGQYPGEAHQPATNQPAAHQTDNKTVDNGEEPSEPNIYSYGNTPSQPYPPPAPQPATEQPINATGPSYTSLENAQPVVLSTNQLEALVEKEKTTNLIVAVIFFVLTMPRALFTLGYNLNEDAEPLDPVPLAVLSDLFFWIYILRSAVLPIVWARLTAQSVI